MTTELSIRSNFFVYVSRYLANNGYVWSLNNLPRCSSEETFTFDTRANGEPEDAPLFVFHSWNIGGIPPPTREQLLAISQEDFVSEKKYLYALRNRRNDISEGMTKDQIIALIDFIPPI